MLNLSASEIILLLKYPQFNCTWIAVLLQHNYFINLSDIKLL